MAEEGGPLKQDSSSNLSASASGSPSELLLKFELRIASQRLAAGALAGCAVSAVWYREPELVYSALETLGTSVLDILPISSFLFKLQCEPQKSSRPFETKTEAKQRFKEQLEKTSRNDNEEVNQTSTEMVSPEEIRISPTVSSVKGGVPFMLECPSNVSEDVTPLRATFGPLGESAELQKTERQKNIFFGIVPAARKPGIVSLMVTTKTGNLLGNARFTYADEREFLANSSQSELANQGF